MGDDRSPTQAEEPQARPPSLAALVLAGGESRRMGAPKALVNLGGIPLIEHTVGRLKPTFGQVYVVGGTGHLPHLGLPVIADRSSQRGPLVGLYSGLVKSGADWCFVVGCDMPLLSPRVVEHMKRFLGSGDIVAALVDRRPQPLHAFYSRRCIEPARELLRRGVTSLVALMDACSTTLVPEEEVERLDPGRRSFLDLDTPEEVEWLERELKR